MQVHSGLVKNVLACFKQIWTEQKSIIENTFKP